MVLALATLSLWCSPSWPLDPEQSFWNAGVAYVGWDKGLADSVTDVVQDGDGFLWIATHQGLVRFDGDEPRIFDVSEHPGLLSNRLERLLIDGRGDLYLLSAKGVARFDRESFGIAADRAELGAAPVAIAEDPDGVVWLATGSDLFTVQGKDITAADSGFPVPIASLVTVGDRLYAGGHGRFGVLEGKHWRQFDLPAGFQSARVSDFCAYQGRTWIATDRGVFSFDGETVVVELAEHLDGRDVRTLLADRDGNLWAGGRSKLVRRFPDGRIETPDLGLSEFGIEAFLERVFEDREGALWLASTRFSLLKVRDAMGRRITFQQGLKAIAVAAVASDRRGRIWLGTDDGVYAVDGDSARLAVAGDDLPHPSVLSLRFDFDDRLWIGTAGGVAVRTEQGDATPPPLAALDGTRVLALLPVAEGTWVGTDHGLFRLREEELTPLVELAGAEIRSLLPGADGGMWIGTHDGLFAHRDGSLERAGVETLLENVVVTALTELPEGELLAASQDNGLFVRHDEQWRHLSRAQGIPINGASFATAAADGHLWIAGSEGIYRVALEQITDPELQRVDATVLAYSGKMIRGADYVDCCRGTGGSNGVYQDRKLWLPTKDGLYVLGIDETPPWKPTAPVFLESLRFGDTRITDPDLERLTLGPGERDLRIDFGALALTAYVDVRYRYRLEGHDDAWIDGGKTGSAQYTNLKPGVYQFEVQAGLLDGVWGKPTTLEIVRQPRYYETAWFRALLAVIALLIVAVLFWLRNSLLRKKRAMIERDIEQRTAELNALNSELSEKNLQLLEASNTDPLTGLLNRRFLLPVLESGEQPMPEDLAARLAQRSAVMLLDVDHFKSINDRLGHLAGDEVLRHLARLLMTLTRAGDFVIRWGGEEFLLVCAQAQGDLSHLAERIRAGIADHEFVLRSGDRLRMTCSIGAVTCPLWGQAPDPVHWNAYLAAADRAMFAVKRHGRDGWVCLSAGARPPNEEQVGWLESRLKDLIDAEIVAWDANRDEIVLGKETARIELD